MNMNILPSFKMPGITYSMTQHPIQAGFNLLFRVVYISAMNSMPVNMVSVTSLSLKVQGKF